MWLYMFISDENSSSLDLQSSRDSIDTLRNVTIKTEPLQKTEAFQSLDDQRVLDLKYTAPLQSHQRSLSTNRVSCFIVTAIGVIFMWQIVLLLMWQNINRIETFKAPTHLLPLIPRCSQTWRRVEFMCVRTLNDWIFITWIYSTI